MQAPPSHPRLPVTLLPAEGVNQIEQAHLSDQLTPTAKATEARPGRSRTNRWRKLWVRLAGPGRFGRCAARLAIRGTQPFHGRAPLARLHPQGFVAPSASLPTQGVTRGQHVYIGDGVVILRHLRGREIQIDDHVCIYGDTLIQTGREAGVVIGAHTHIQPGCHFSAFVADIRIGSHVEVAPDCAFFSYNHGIAAGTLVRDQPLRSSGPVIIGDGAWLGYGCVVLAGVEIGAGAIVGARSVVTRSIPANAVAVGSPARVLRYRA